MALGEHRGHRPTRAPSGRARTGRMIETRSASGIGVSAAFAAWAATRAEVVVPSCRQASADMARWSPTAFWSECTAWLMASRWSVSAAVEALASRRSSSTRTSSAATRAFVSAKSAGSGGGARSRGGPARGSRRGVEVPLTGAHPRASTNHTGRPAPRFRGRRGRLCACRCARTARTSRAAPTRTGRRCGSATSTSRPRRPGAARPTAPSSSAGSPTSTGATARLVTPPTPDEPLDALDRDDGSVAAVLDEAEDYLNSVGAQVLAEVQAEQARQGPPQAPLPPQALSASTLGSRRNPR